MTRYDIRLVQFSSFHICRFECTFTVTEALLIVGPMKRRNGCPVQ